MQPEINFRSYQSRFTVVNSTYTTARKKQQINKQINKKTTKKLLHMFGFHTPVFTKKKKGPL